MTEIIPQNNNQASWHPQEQFDTALISDITGSADVPITDTIYKPEDETIQGHQWTIGKRILRIFPSIGRGELYGKVVQTKDIQGITEPKNHIVFSIQEIIKSKKKSKQKVTISFSSNSLIAGNTLSIHESGVVTINETKRKQALQTKTPYQFTSEDLDGV